MKKTEFDPGKVIGSSICGYDRQQLCEFTVKLCERVKADVGAGAYRGGIYPDNISMDASGELAIGPASKEDWTGQELQFLPPELYWNHRPGPASDVYAIGMVLYYAVTGGRLPFDGECKDAQLRRMGGDDFPAPREAGRRLGDIIKKATRFKAADRYQSMDELRVMAESCLKNLYLNGAPSAETIFNKNDDDLSDIERLMVGIIERDEEQPLPEPELTAPPQEEPAVEAPEEQFAAAEDASGDDAAAPQDEFELAAQIAREAEAAGASAPGTPAGRQRVPRLYVEKNPELEPVVLKKQPEITPVVQYTRNPEKERRMAEEVKKRRRRPVAVILVLCAVLVIVAIIFNALIKDINGRMATNDPGAQAADATAAPAQSSDGQDAQAEQPVESAAPVDDVDPADLLPIEPDPEGTPYIPGAGGTDAANGADGTGTNAAAPDDSTTAAPREHGYELVIEDISWTDAQKKCAEMGGHLAVPNDAAEFNALVDLAESKNVTMLWIGGHRENGAIVWEDGSTDPYEQWAKGEPSYVDSSDGAAEDYVLLWNNRGWYYNDSRNDPCKEFPQWYGGKMAYICEFGD